MEFLLYMYKKYLKLIGKYDKICVTSICVNFIKFEQVKGRGTHLFFTEKVFGDRSNVPVRRSIYDYIAYI